MKFRVTQTRHSVIVVAACVFALSAASCGSSSASSATSSNAGSPTASSGNSGLAFAKAQVAKYSGPIKVPTVAAIANPVDLKGKTVWYIPITNSVLSLSGMGTTMAAALSHLGATVHVCDGQALPTTIASCLTTAGQQGAAAVVTAFVDYAMVPTAFKALEAKNIPVLVAGETPPAGVTPSADLQFLDASNVTNLGDVIAAYVAISSGGGKGDMMVIKLTDSPGVLEASNAQIKALEKYCTACKVNSISMNTANISQLPSELSAALVAHPNTNYILVPNDGFVPPVFGAISSSGFTNKVKVIAFGAGVAGLKEVKAGTLAFDVGGPIEYTGWEFADALIRMMSGLSVQPEPAGPMRIFDSSNVQSLSLTTANYLTPSFFGVSQGAFEAPYLAAWKAS